MAPELDQWAEQKQARKEAYAQRRAFGRGPAHRIARQLMAAMNHYDAMRKDGVTQYDACKGLELILRETYPLTKFPVKCADCGDTGYQERVCKDTRRCGGHLCSHEPGASLEHLYVEPCVCPFGDKFRKRVWTPDTDAPIAAGKVKRKATGFARVGR